MDYHFVFIPWRSGHVCIMLDPKYTPHYKQYPWAQNFCITQADYDTIERSGLSRIQSGQRSLRTFALTQTI